MGLVTLLNDSLPVPTALFFNKNLPFPESIARLPFLQYKKKPLSGLLADHDLESDIGTGSVSVSSVTSPISQSSYNPLLDELVHQASDDSAYMVMSPATSSGKWNTSHFVLTDFFLYCRNRSPAIDSGNGRFLSVGFCWKQHSLTGFYFYVAVDHIIFNRFL